MIYNKIKFFLLLFLSFNIAFAGNEDRAGSAGATELLVNPWQEVQHGVLQVFHLLMD